MVAGGRFDGHRRGVWGWPGRPGAAGGVRGRPGGRWGGWRWFTVRESV